MNASLFSSNKSQIINWRISRLVAWYTFRDIFRSFGTYVLLSLGWIGVYLSIGNTLKVIQQGYATVIREPLSLIVLGMLIISSLFFSIIAGISVVRDREQGVVELLFYGPISHSEYVIGKFLAHWIFYAILVFIFLIGTGMMASLVKLPISLYLVWLYGFSLALSAAMIAVGQLLAVLTRSIRGTVFVFSVVMVVFLIIQLGNSFLPSVTQMESTPALIGLRDTLAIVSSAISWLSPISVFLKGVEGLVRNNIFDVLSQGVWLLLFTLIINGLVVVIHSRREILP
jgi:ABC-type transport system involved in multi-copper enzyme maturation permease subunit